MVRTADLVSFSSDAAFSVSAEMRVVSWNAGAERMLGYAADDIIGRPCADILRGSYETGEPLCSPLCEGMSCFVRGEAWAVRSCRLRHKDGAMIQAAISTLVAPSDDPEREDAVAVIFLQDMPRMPEAHPTTLPLRIFTFGHFGLTVAGRGLAVDKWKRKHALTLLKCLVVHLGRPVHREILIEQLWPDAELSRGLERLKVAVSYLRAQLRAGGLKDDSVVQTVGQSYLLRRDAVWVDADVFERLAAEGSELASQGSSTEAVARFESAKRLYRGLYLEDDPYVDWCAEERERLREVFLDTMIGLADSHAEQGNLLEAAQVCRAALYKDPCRESFQQRLLQHLVHLGRSDWAEMQFHSWRQTLAEEFGLEPMPETMRLYRQILGSQSDNEPDRAAVPDIGERLDENA